VIKYRELVMATEGAVIALYCSIFGRTFTIDLMMLVVQSSKVVAYYSMQVRYSKEEHCLTAPYYSKAQQDLLPGDRYSSVYSVSDEVGRKDYSFLAV